MANGFRCAFCGNHEEEHGTHLCEQERYERGIHHPVSCQLGYTKGHAELAFDRQQLEKTQADLAHTKQEPTTLAHQG